MICKTCKKVMTPFNNIRTARDAHMNIATRSIRLEQGGVDVGLFHFNTDVEMCRHCFWRSVQKIADIELIEIMKPSDFKNKH